MLPAYAATMSVLTRAWRLRLGGRAADAAVAIAVAVTVIAGTLLGLNGPGDSGRLDALGWLLILAASAALYVRRRHPVATAVFTLVVCLLYYPLNSVDGPVLLTFIVALYTVAAEGQLTAAVVLGVATMLAVSVDTVLSGPRHVDNIAMFMLAGWLVAVIAVGGVKRGRFAYLREVEQRAIAAEHGREAEARRRATEERLRIARELHDTLGHNISLINVQAGAALHSIKKDPGQAEEALGAIKQTSKDALRELRSTLGVLRSVDEEASTAPAPGLARLNDLVDRANAAGLVARTEIEGEPQPVPPQVDLAAYRIIQEALTNVTRHAAATTTVVRIRYRRDDVCVQVDDDGKALDGAGPGDGPSTTEDDSPGSGIRGMDERARALGGELTAASLPGGGFRVRARLPLGGGT